MLKSRVCSTVMKIQLEVGVGTGSLPSLMKTRDDVSMNCEYEIDRTLNEYEKMIERMNPE